jgi:hypothetical protein
MLIFCSAGVADIATCTTLQEITKTEWVSISGKKKVRTGTFLGGKIHPFLPETLISFFLAERSFSNHINISLQLHSRRIPSVDSFISIFYPFHFSSEEDLVIPRG